MIPNNITLENVISAIEFIDNNNVPRKRVSRDWFLVYNDQQYPPKYCISIANQFANGQELNSSDFVTSEAVNYLIRLGFILIEN